METLNQHHALSDYFPMERRHIEYLVNWSKKNGLIYVETPKVGCTTIKKILQYNELDLNESSLPSDVHDRGQSPFLSPRFNESEFLDALVDPNVFKFTFVRNPFTRVLSAYLDKIIGRPGVVTKIQQQMGINPFEYIPTFAEFIEMVYGQKLDNMNPHWAPQTFLVGYNLVDYDFLGRFECFDGSLQELASRANLEIPVAAIVSGRPHATRADEKAKQYYTNDIVKRVREIYYDDFKFLGYGWSP